MNKYYITGLLLVFVASAFAQGSTAVLTASSEYKIALAKTTIHLTEWHEETFWDQFGRYVDEDVAINNKMYPTLVLAGNVSKDQLSPAEGEALAGHLIKDRYVQLSVWQKYFDEISAAHNGVIALKFLQTEVLLDMLESARMYEQTPLREYRFHDDTDTTGGISSETRNQMVAALRIPSVDSVRFFNIYSRYKNECDTLLGSDYGLIANFADEPSDYTPAQAKQVGRNLSEVIRREISLKEKYFKAFNDDLGGLMAVRFLAWEDYYSIVSKLDTWADAR